MIKITITEEEEEEEGEATIKCSGGTTGEYLGILIAAYEALKEQWMEGTDPSVKFQGVLVPITDEEE